MVVNASITDASAWLIQHKMTGPQREALLDELFGAPPAGLGLSFTRLTIGASDFSRTHYSFDDMPPGATDPGLAHVSIEPNRARCNMIGRWRWLSAPTYARSSVKSPV